jgi:hypothetical protein
MFIIYPGDCLTCAEMIYAQRQESKYWYKQFCSGDLSHTLQFVFGSFILKWLYAY